MEQPADKRIDPAKQPFRVDARQADCQDVGRRGDPGAAAILPAARQQRLRLAGMVGDNQAERVEAAEEAVEAALLQPRRSEFRLEAIDQLAEAPPAVEQAEHGAFLVAELEVAEGNGVLDDPIPTGAALLWKEDEVAARPQPQRSARCGFGGWWA